jgi:hypothetical protein
MTDLLTYIREGGPADILKLVGFVLLFTWSATLIAVAFRPIQLTNKTTYNTPDE